MKLESQRILVTGAGGGIGQALCAQLTARGAKLCLVDRNPEFARRSEQDCPDDRERLLLRQADITHAHDRENAVGAMLQAWGGIDILINLAGVLDFACFDAQDPGTIQRIIQVNVEAPMLLSRLVLPRMIEQRHGRIVNVGSMFGSIGFPCFAAYSASKFAMRGFSQALRRELAGTGVGVTYMSPRAVKTAFNPPAVHHMAALGMMHMDEPDRVVRKLVQAIEKEREEVYLGFPESLFARINAILPRVVSRAIVKQVPALVSFSQQDAKV